MIELQIKYIYIDFNILYLLLLLLNNLYNFI